MGARLDIMMDCKLPSCDNTFKSRKTRAGYQEYCSRACWFKRSQYLKEQGEKGCSTCKITKSFSEFNLDRRSATGYSSKCKACNVRYSNTYSGKLSARFKARCANYGLTVEQYNHMLEVQNNCCASCGDIFTKTPHIDHDHACCDSKNKACGNCVRGLLCDSCNNILGRAKDSISRLEQCIEYLKINVRD